MLESPIGLGKEEFHLISQTENPPISADTEFVWILSSRHDIKCNHVNCALKSKNFTPIPGTQAPDVEIQCDPEDDLQRIKSALYIAQTVTAKRLKKNQSALTEEDFNKSGPMILYNGFPEQNESFREAIEKGLSDLNLINYPASKILIFDMPSDQLHTGGQLTSLAELVQKESRLQKLKSEEACHVTIVTSAYHVPRVRRLLTSKIYCNPFSVNVELSFFAVDRKFARDCAKRDLEGELARLVQYTARGTIGEKPGKSNWYALESIQQWTPLRTTWLDGSTPLFKREQRSAQVTTKACISP